MKNNKVNMTAKTENASEVAAWLLDYQFTADVQEIHRRFSQLDAKRLDGSRIQTARHIIMRYFYVARCVGIQDPDEFGVNLVLDWLYYRRGGKE